MIRRPPTSPLFHSTTLILLRQVSRRCKLGELYMKNCTSVIYGPNQLNPPTPLSGKLDINALRFKALRFKLGELYMKNCTSVIYGPIQLKPAHTLQREVGYYC